MMDLSNIDLLSLQSKFMQQDLTTQALCSALTPQFQQLASEIQACLIYTRIDELDDQILDEVAWQMHVDWYDPKADIVIKRQLVKKSLKVHRYRGTPYAVEEVLKDYFDDAEVKEWFEYGGDPYMFKVIVRNQAVSGELADRFTMALNSVKNLRSHLEEIVFGLFCSDTIYCSDSLIII
jgi:phage tail P2-like protein